ncbi:TetR/AcrR family transcriptional regulator C-terminal domain-containing protein [Antribacter sp. KLBMP9083]|uniref:TetR/AcrR family transcriptional regulator C-terminal domain-containing protein n=1 Tax=Antribacter soli TaxID=2910976 RepID=A0AA41QHZ8_9MICO|nr:TetR/AcrR family transcriptional regulator C-terminal domain-containing protein [Antribacter soli]MCF4122484.1 TetR/AcrR family transcriptional regulator C-terminal domain-containing protein [Antribacter soli]
MTTTYERIADLIAARIEDGDLSTGDLVPSTRRIVAEHGVAMATATRVLDELRRRGLVEARRGVGTVVAARLSGVPAARITTADVVRAAVALADSDGLGGLSMRRIATDLGMPTMSLYRHVTSREDLVARMLDAVYGESPLPDPLPDGWRARAETVARTLWAAFTAHPWAAHAMSMTRPQPAANGIAHTEALLAAFDITPGRLDVDVRMHLAVTVFQFVRGVAVNVEPAEQARQDTGLSDEDWMDRALPSLQAVTDVRRHPHLAEAMSTGIDLTLDSLFEFGLARLLDGYAVFLRA